MTLNNFIKTYCVPTGSYHWGVYTDKSDMDYLIRRRDLEQHLCDGVLLNNYPIQEVGIYDKKAESQSYYIHLEGQRSINLIAFWEENDFLVWKRATTLMSLMPKGLIKEKLDRITLFEVFRSLLHNKRRKK